MDKVAVTVVHDEVGLHAAKTKIWKSFFKLWPKLQSGMVAEEGVSAIKRKTIKTCGK